MRACVKQSSEARFRNPKHASRLWVVSSWIAPNQCFPLTIELRHAGRDDRRHHAYRRAPSGPETKISAFERLRCSWILNPTPLVPRSNPRTWPTRTKHCEKSAAPPRKTSRVITRGTRRMMCVSFIIFYPSTENATEVSFQTSCEYSTRSSTT